MLTLKTTKTTPKTALQSLQSVFPTFSHIELGIYGEFNARRVLRALGHIVTDVHKQQFAGDLLLLHKDTGEYIRIECKTARPSKRGTFKFCLTRSGKTCHKHSDFCFLTCIDNSGKHYYYIIPCSVLKRKNIEISSHPSVYSGRFAKYRIRNNAFDFYNALILAEMSQTS